MATKSFVNVRYDMAKKLAYFVEYLRIYWTDFRNLFTIWKLYMNRWRICALFSNFSKDVAMATKIVLREMRK